MTRITHTLSLYCSVLLLGLFSLSAYAKGDFYATVSQNKVVQNQVFQLTVTIDRKVSSQDIDFAVLQKDFQVGRPNFGTSTQIINGDRSEQSQWTIQLAAKKTGILRIPQFTIDGQHTQSIAIQVSKDADAPQTKDIIEVQSHLSKTTLYPNESALLKARLIVKADPRRLQGHTIEPPKVDGMELKPASEPEQHQDVINGMQVTIVDQSFRVTAIQPGRFQLTEPKFDGSIVYGDSYGGATRVIPLHTAPKTYTVNVKPKPKNYQGVWLPTSQLTLSQSWQDPDGKPIKSDTVDVKVGDSITRTISMQVADMPKERLPDIAITNPNSVRVYNDKPKFSTLKNGDTLMTLKQVIIPRQSGKLTLPSVSVNWWNSETNQEKRSQVAGLILHVTPGDDAQPLPAESQPSTPPAKTVITKTQAGFWPYLTAGFAVLWLATLLLAWYWKRASSEAKASSPNHKATQATPSQTPFEALKAAIMQQDGIAVSQALSQWQQSVHLTDDELATLARAKTAFNQALYANHDEAQDGESLLDIVKRLEKTAKPRKAASQKADPLPPL